MSPVRSLVRSGTAVIALALVAALLAASGVLLALSRDWSPSVLTSSGGSESLKVGLTNYDTAERVSMPDLQGADLHGRPVALSDYDNQILVINVWGSWCRPCRAEAPDLAGASRSFRSDGVQFIGIDTRDNVSSALSFEARYDIPYPSFDERARAVLADFPDVVPLSAVPSTVFVDSEGQVAATVIGRVTGEVLQEQIGALIDERDTSGARS